MQRRTVITWTCALLPLLGLAVSARRDGVADSLAAITELFAEPGQARALGQNYLLDHPAEGDAAMLLQAVFGMARGAGLRGVSLRRAIARLRAVDFAAGDITLIDGWVFARSEARIMALATMA
jgi:hypothetical protein